MKTVPDRLVKFIHLLYPAGYREKRRVSGKKQVHSIDLHRPFSVGIESSTACQLKCRTCPTSRGMIDQYLGTGYLSPEKFESFLVSHPWIRTVELSNWGEALLNPHFIDLLRIAAGNNVNISIHNGVNLNSARDEQLEALVKYRVRNITCSIDGASQETYSIYRVNGNFERVVGNILKINSYKEKYQSVFPRLKWQYVAFGHNEHEIGKARDMAADLNMTFKLKLSWEDILYENFSPVVNKAVVREASSSGTADRGEFERKYGKPYIDSCCIQMWKRPRINYDGRVLGCCVNFREDFGNAFSDGLESCLRSDKMKQTRDLLMGAPASRTDIPCLNCRVYESRVRLGRFVTKADLYPLKEG